MKRIILAIFLVVAAGVVAGAYYASRTDPRPAISTALVSQGSIVDSVSATGTIQAVTTGRSAARYRVGWRGLARTSTRPCAKVR